MNQHIYTGWLNKNDIKILKENFPQVVVHGTFHGKTTIGIPIDDVERVTHWCKDVGIEIEWNQPLMTDDLNEEEKQRAKFDAQRSLDETTTWIIDTYPRMWRGVFNNCIAEGFSEAQAMDLLKTFILSFGGTRQ